MTSRGELLAAAVAEESGSPGERRGPGGSPRDRVEIWDKALWEERSQVSEEIWTRSQRGWRPSGSGSDGIFSHFCEKITAQGGNHAFEHTSVLLHETVDGLTSDRTAFMLTQRWAEADMLLKCADV